MFTHLLPSSDSMLFRVEFNTYSERNFLKKLKKKYPDKVWEVTIDSIIQDLSRIRTADSDLQKTQQVDELWHKDDFWIFKYDFRIAGTNSSAKKSGNRIVAFLNLSKNIIDIILIYDKNYLPKNKKETVFIAEVIKKEFPNYWGNCH